MLTSFDDRLLVRHPHVLNRLRDEIHTVLAGKPEPSREDLKRMTYLMHVLKETLHLYSSVHVNFRIVTRITTLLTGGDSDGTSPALIRRDVPVIYNVYALHRRTDLYGEDSENFRPERWEGNRMPLFRDETSSNFEYLPFNGGPKVCLGQNFALVKVSYAVVRILQRFPNIRLLKGQGYEKIGSERQKMTLVLTPADDCVVQLK